MPERPSSYSLQNTTNFSSNNIKKTLFSKILSAVKAPFAKVNLEREEAQSSQFTKTQHEILDNFLSFAQKTVEDVMIPRSDISAVKKAITLEELSSTVADLTHTRTLVYDDNLDNIVGFVHIQDLFKIVAGKKTFNIQQILRKPLVAPQSMKLVDLLHQMQKKRIHIAIVVDEYGGTDGMVTINDIIEEILGDIDDEFDKITEDDKFEIIDDHTVIASARVDVKTLEKIIGSELSSQDDEFDTIGGLVMAKVGRVPPAGTMINLSPAVVIEVIDASPRTLKKVKLKIDRNV